jgi:cation diffusion facilitator family transporter
MPSSTAEESARTVVVAVLANLGIAIAKTVAAIFTGSASLWAEAAHSVADTGNEVLLFVGLRKSSRPPDAAHPFGRGQERYFWAFLAALGIFLVGGTLSIGEGVRSLLLPEPLESLWVGVGVLLVSACFEGYSWHTARKQLRDNARDQQRSLFEQLRRASDPSATTVFLEDSAALVGLLLALVALLLHGWTGWAGWDALGSIAIGALLIAVAFLLAVRSKALMLEEAAPADVADPIRARVLGFDWVGELDDMQAVYLGPSSLLVNLWIRPSPSAATAPGSELVVRAGRLRSELLDDPGIAQVTVTLVG